ncbi:MAG: hypothetical protein PVJ83_09290 [Gammaproteobacteria bacterium]|jgi:hypothetical protein
MNTSNPANSGLARVGLTETADMLEAIWSVEFVSHNYRVAGGVVMFENGRIFGGDSNFYYLGTYETHDGKVTARVKFHNFTGITSLIFGEGLTEFSVQVEGNLSHDSFVANGHLVQDADYEFEIGFKRQAELP